MLQNVAVIGAEGDPVEEHRPRTGPGTASTEEAAEEQKEVEISSGPAETGLHAGVVPSHGRSPISPRARKLACQKRVVLEGIQGSGPGGRIIEGDVMEAFRQGRRLTPLAQKKSEAEGLTVPAGNQPDCGRYGTKDLVKPAAVSAGASVWEGTGPYTDIPLSQVRKIIATAMHRSLQNSAQLTHHLSANVSGMLALRHQVKARQKEGYAYNITLNDMVCYALIRALRKHPDANVHFLGDSIRYFTKVHLGMAVDTERGLMVPALRNADDLSLPGLSTQLSRLAAACRGGSVDPDLLQPEAATFTVSNLGAYGVEMFTPVINLPQAGILGVNTIIQRPAQLEGGAFGFVPYMGLSLTYDHRALDGGPATLLLAEVKQEIETFDHDLIKL